MRDFLKQIQANALLSAALYTLLGLVLLIWPAPSASLLCIALGLVLTICGVINILVFLSHRDGTLYAGFLLITGIILAVVGIWLLARPTLVTVIIPRIIGLLVCVHGFRDIRDTLSLKKSGSSRWTAALLLGAVTLVLGAILVLAPFEAFTTVVRLIGAFLIYDGISDIWITTQVSKAVRYPAKASNSDLDAVDVEYRDVGDEESEKRRAA